MAEMTSEVLNGAHPGAAVVVGATVVTVVVGATVVVEATECMGTHESFRLLLLVLSVCLVPFRGHNAL